MNLKRKSILLFGLFLLLISLIGSPAFAKQPILNEKMKFQGLPDDDSDYPVINEKEPNDTFENATMISLEDDVNGNLSQADKDLYKLTISNKGYFYMMGQTSNPSSSIAVKLYKKLADGSKEEIAVEYNDSSDGIFMIGNTISESGDYFIELKEVNGILEDSPYEFFTMFMEPEVQRIFGQDRFETAAEVANDGWGYSDEIILATGRSFPDALAAAPLAIDRDAPILLTEKDSIPSSVLEAIDELEVEKVTIIGGTKAVSKTVEDYLSYNLDLDVERIAGGNRYETSVEIAKKLPESETAFVVSGQNYPDALSVGSYAAMQGFPILLTETNALSSAVKKQLANYENSYVIGGKSAVSASVLNQLPNPTRISGKDRYETSVKVAEEFLTPEMYFATITTGTDFADALSGSVHAAMHMQPIILTPPDALSTSALQLFTKEHTLWFTIIGGNGAVSKNVKNQLLQLGK